MSKAKLGLSPALEALFIWVFISLAGAVSIGAIYEETLEHERDNIYRKLIQMSSIGEILVDGDKLKLLTEDSHTDNPVYTEMIAPMVEFHRRVEDLIYVYTMVRQNGRNYFVLDTTRYTQDLRPEANLKANRVMSEYEVDDPLIKEVYATEKAVVGNIEEGEFGTLKSAYAPIFDSQKNLVGVFCVDMDISEYMRRTDKVFNISLAGLSLMCVLGAAIAFITYITRLRTMAELNKSIREIERKNEEIDRKNNDNLSLLSATLPGDLASRLMNGEHISASQYFFATAVFIEISGSIKAETSETLAFINKFCAKLNTLSDRHGVTPIVGVYKGYLAVCLNSDKREHWRSAEMALDAIYQFYNFRNESREENLVIKIGISAGKLIAGEASGVKFAYDLRENTIARAQILETRAKGNKILCDEVFASLLNNEYLFEEESGIETLGSAKTYYLVKKISRIDAWNIDAK